MKRLAIRNRMKWSHPLPGGSALVVLFLVLLQWPASAQNPSQQPEDPQKKIESLKSAYLTQELKLSPDEAKKFWPVYQQYQTQMEQLAEQRRQNQLNRNQMKHPSDAQIDQSLDRDFRLQQQALQLREQYRNRFRQVIPSQKVMQFYKSEKDFNMKLVRELRRRGNNEGNPTPVRVPRSQPDRTPVSRPRSRPEPTRSQPPRNIRPARGGAAIHGGARRPNVRGR